jgi:ubiquinone/menaquinone biosynthesis C-methylase UbiE
MQTTQTKKGYKGLAMEGLIATRYAKLTLKDLNRHKLMASKMAEKIPAGAKVLEIAPGPGYFCIELAKLGDFQVTGMDISKTFVQIARANAQAANMPIDFREGNASAMPFDNESFDFTFCQAAFKNFSQPIQAIAGMYRVLRPGGTAVIVDMRRDASSQDIEREVRGMHLGRWDEWTTRLTFKLVLLKTAYSVAEMKSMIAQTPFGTARIDVGGIGFTIWLEKQNL